MTSKYSIDERRAVLVRKFCTTTAEILLFGKCLVDFGTEVSYKRQINALMQDSQLVELSGARVAIASLRSFDRTLYARPAHCKLQDSDKAELIAALDAVAACFEDAFSRTVQAQVEAVLEDTSKS